jgi:hypothetical protein
MKLHHGSFRVQAKCGVFACRIIMLPTISGIDFCTSSLSPTPMWQVPESTVTRSTAGSTLQARPGDTKLHRNELQQQPAMLRRHCAR